MRRFCGIMLGWVSGRNFPNIVEVSLGLARWCPWRKAFDRSELNLGEFFLDKSSDKFLVFQHESPLAYS